MKRLAFTAIIALGISASAYAQRQPTTQSYSNLPLNFEQNVGQTDGQAQFISHGKGYTLFLSPNQAILKLHAVSPLAMNSADEKKLGRRFFAERAMKATRQTAVVRMKLLGANPGAQLVGVDKLTGIANYFIGSDPSKWQAGIPVFAKVQSPEVFPGIDLVYYGNEKRLEYDFVVKPGADPNAISLGFDGIQGTSLDKSGNLSMTTDIGGMNLNKPVVYQVIGGQRKEVAGKYALRGANAIGFEVTDYDKTQPLIIDPVLVYSTYLGGSGGVDGAYGIAVNSTGDAYVVGITDSTDFPIVGTLLAPAPSGNEVAFVSKFNSTGTALIYSTYLGGNGGDWGSGIALDANGSAYVVGQTGSSNFPVTSNAYQTSLGSGASQNAFVSKLSADGQSLLYSTYLGGGGYDQGIGIALDSNQNAYVTGYTTSGSPNPFPTTANAFQSTLHSTYGNGFISRIDTTKSGSSSLVYSTFLGGSGNWDQTNGIAVDANQNVYVGGMTSSSDFPLTASAYQTVVDTYNGTGFLTQIDSTKSGSAGLIYSTVIEGEVYAAGVALDSYGKVYATAGYVAKFDTSKSGAASLLYFTRVGGSSDAFTYSIAVDPNGDSYVSGWTWSSDLPVTSDAIQSTLGSSGQNAFVTALSANGSTVLFGTYLGGNGGSDDFASGIAVDANYNMYVSGFTQSSNFQTTSGAFQTSLNGAMDGFVLKFSPPNVPIIASISPTTGVVGATVTISGTNFGASQGNSTVTFTNGATAVVTNWAATSIVVKVPTGATTGNVVVTVSSNQSNGVNFGVAGSTASFVGYDGTSQGSWHGAYGTDGYSVANDSQSIPSYASFAVQNQGNYTWAASTTDVRALQTGSGSSRIAATWYNGSTFNFDVNFTDGNVHQFALYELDWDNGGRAETIQVVDASSGAVLDTRSISSFANGIYLIWSISGHVKINVTGTAGPNSVVSGAFFGLGTGGTIAPVAVISSLSPNSGAIGVAVTILGSNFAGNSSVFFSNNVAATVTNWTPTSITTTVPSGATTGNVVVSTIGEVSNGVLFTVLAAPTISGVAPTSGVSGTQVTITGNNFGASQGSGSVAFNGVTASIRSWSSTSIVAVVPGTAAPGPVDVEAAGVTAQGPNFVVTSSAQLTDSQGHTSTYLGAVEGGRWTVTSAQGSGCSTCTVRGINQYAYDAYGNVTSMTDPAGHVTTYTYDSSNNMLSQSVQLTSTTAATTTYTYNSFGEVLTVTDPLGNVTTSAYDTHGNLTSVTSPAPNSSTAASVTTFAYNSMGELTTITDPLGHVTTMTYTPAGLIATITDAQGNVTTYGYDAKGNRTSVTDALNHTTTFAYDAMSRLTTITYPDSTTSSFIYDIRGRRTSVTDQNGKTTSYAYDDADRLTSVTDAANHVTYYAYDTEDNLTSITGANSNQTAFTYDAFGRVTQTNFPSSLSEYYQYDADNNLTQKTDRKGQTITYLYDALSRLTQKTYPDTTSIEYVYDLVGKITQVNDPTGTYAFVYDNMGRLIGTTTNYSFLASRNFTNAYTYDAASNRTGFTDPEGGSTAYSYDTLNRLSSLAPPSAFGSGSFGFSYDALSRRTQMTRPNSVATNYSYDSLSRLTSVLHQLSASTIDGASYTLDAAGNRTSKTDQLAAVTSNYTYDLIYQLTQVTQANNTTESYSFDAVGNRTASLGVSSYTTNASNELTATSNASYTYDSNGNTLTRTVGSNTTGYTWDFENRLTSVTLPGSGGTVSFKYDPLGRRIEKVSPTFTSIFAHDGNNLVETTNSSGTVVARYTQTQNIDEPLAELSSSTTSYYEADGLGSITSLTSSAGAVANTYTYDSFGNLNASAGSVANPFQYAGREFDSETGLYYYRARYYDPAAGRFLSEDPIRFSAGINFYAYVGNEPIDLLDPYGLQCTQQAQKKKRPLDMSQNIVTPRKPGTGPGPVTGGNGQISTTINGKRVDVSASATVGNVSGSTTGDQSIVLGAPSIGVSVDVTVNGPTKDQKQVGEIDYSAMKNLGVGTTVVQNPDGTISYQGTVVHVGVGTPDSPFPLTGSVPVSNGPVCDNCRGFFMPLL